MTAGPEITCVEEPIIDQLVGMGWKFTTGNLDFPSATGRGSFREVFLYDDLRTAIRRINLDDQGQEWLDNGRIAAVISALDRIAAPKLIEANKTATEVLLKGVAVEGLPGWAARAGGPAGGVGQGESREAGEMSPRLTVDDLSFEVLCSTRRTTLELTVERDGGLSIRAPEGTAPAVLEDFVREKRFWLYTKLAEKNALRQAMVTKEFVSGEGFPYLGRSYRLLLVDEQEVPLKLDAGRFRLLRCEAPRGREHFLKWYISHALPWLRRRVQQFAPRVGAEPSRIDVRDLGFRWGSCGKSGTLNFHWATILLPPSIVEYVVVHELVHLHEPNHTPQFWTRVERAMPDYVRRKEWLAEKGGQHAGV